MCKSKAQGGQRCHAHASADYMSATRVAGVDEFSAPYRVNEDNRDAYRTKLVDYATTPRGAMNLRQIIATWPKGHTARRELEAVFREGVKLRQERDDLYQQWRAEHGLPSRQRNMFDESAWKVPANADRCEKCGQFVASAGHECPPRALLIPVRPPASYASRCDERALTLDDGTSLPIVEPPASATCAEMTSLMETQEDAYYDEYIATFADGEDPDSSELLPPAASEYVADALNSQIAESIDFASINGDLPMIELEYAQSFLKHDTVVKLSDEMRRIDPDFREVDSVPAAEDAVRSWAFNYSYATEGEQQLARYHRAAERLSRGINPLGQCRTGTDEYDAALVVVAQYRLTQKWLADRDIKEVPLHRGVAFWDGDDEPDRDFGIAPAEPEPDRPREYRWVPGWVPAEEIERSGSGVVVQGTADKPLASYSDSRTIAATFAEHPERQRGYVASTIMPAERLIALPSTGMGCTVEREVVALPGPGQWLVNDFRNG